MTLIKENTEQKNKNSIETVASEIAKGLISTKLEGSFDTIIKTTNNADYPSIGVGCWEQSRADDILKAVGLAQYAKKNCGDLSDSDITKIKTALSSEKGQQVQTKQLIADAKEVLANIASQIPSMTNIACMLYIGLWAPTTYMGSVTCSFVAKRLSGYNINNLESLNSMFANSQYAIAMDCAEYAEGYNNRAQRTYEYCKNLGTNGTTDLSTINLKSIAKSAQSNPLSVSYSAPASASVENGGSESCLYDDIFCKCAKHSDTKFESPAKLYCEPVYPDYISVGRIVPEYLVESLINSSPKQTITSNGAKTGMWYKVSNDDAGYTSLYKAEDEQRATVLSVTGNKAKLMRKSGNSVYSQDLVVDQLKNVAKELTTGKPVNNSDPYPVDSKIGELELHMPRAKIDSITTCTQGIEASKAVIQLSINTERRLVKLENLLAYTMRNLIRLGAVTPINCVYYGGQSLHEKYRCIRCLRDDRLSDQLVQIDNCLNCTRREPLIGQCYDILSETGQNLSQILDDNQMSYSTMEDYINFSQGTKYETKLKKASINLANIKTRDVNDNDMNWSQGQVMKWNTVPVEDQTPHINKTQNSNGTSYSVLDSYQNSASNKGIVSSAKPSSGLLAVKEKMDDVIAGKIISSFIYKTVTSGGSSD